LKSKRFYGIEVSMKLTADEQGRLVSPQLFRPKAIFDATIESDGSIRLVEVAATQMPVLKPRFMEGRLRGADVRLNRETVAAAVRAERDAR
jgi:hypothetical protein